MTRSPFSYRIKASLLLGAIGFFATVCVMPYALALTPGRAFSVPMPLLFAAQGLQGGLITFILAWFGLRCAEATGLTTPLLRRVIAGDPLPARFSRLLLLAGVIGVLAGALGLAGDALYFSPRIFGGSGLTGIPAWKGFLASFYGGVVEEVELRLFLMSFLAWVISRIVRAFAGERPIANVVFVSAIVLSTVIFGAAHLPAAAQAAAAQATHLTPLAITRIFVLNAVVGLPCGWLFWRKGFDAAMVAHFAADLVLHVISALAV